MKNQKLPPANPASSTGMAKTVPVTASRAPRYLFVAQPYSPVTMADCIVALQNEVNSHLADGGACVGGPFLLSGALCQAVIVP